MLALRQAEGVQEQPSPLLPTPPPPNCPLSSQKAILFSQQSPVHMAPEQVMKSNTPQGHCLRRLAGCLLNGSFRGLWGCCRLFCCKPLGGCCLLSLPSEPRRESGVLGETKQAMVRGPKKEQMPSQQTVHQGLEPLGAEGTRDVRYLLAVRSFGGTNAKDFRGRTGARHQE